MSDLTQWFYTYYIKPYIENQPKDELTAMQFDLLNNELCPSQKEALRPVLDVYALRGFRLGLKTGLALAADLQDRAILPNS